MADNQTRQTNQNIGGEENRPAGARAANDDFREDIGEQTPQRVHQQHLDADAGDADKQVVQMLPDLRDDQLARLSILDPGTPLEQGGIYLNLDNREQGPFKAIGGQEVGADERIIAKKMTDYELWNEIVGRDDEADIERPETT